MSTPTIIVHGGAGAIHEKMWRLYQDGAHQAALAGQAVLDQGGNAINSVIAAVLYMENSDLFNTGIGSNLNHDGAIECDAFVMDDRYNIGAIAGVKGVRNPVLLARVVMDHTPHHLLVSNGAIRLARKYGIELMDPIEMIVERRRLRWEQMIEREQDYASDPELITVKETPTSLIDTDSDPGDANNDTVGACAIDSTGRIAVASSTGGIMLKLPGRAGDTPVPGSGSYCGPAGAVTCTGHGESVMRVCLAKYAYDLLEDGASASEAANASVDHLVDRVDGRAGLIVLDSKGHRAWNTSTLRISTGLPEHLVDHPKGCIKMSRDAKRI